MKTKNVREFLSQIGQPLMNGQGVGFDDVKILKTLHPFMSELDEFKDSDLEIIDIKFSEPTVTFENNKATVSSYPINYPDLITIFSDEKYKVRFSKKVKLFNLWMQGDKVFYRVTEDSIIPPDEWRDNQIDKVIK